MRLTRIEIHGFKSFADRTPLDLPGGLTAIVGPNGCGKSNVIDAVKWCLGEQRPTALRGGEMLDVIFKGNGARGERNFAEASLFFDNSDGVLPIDYSEVVITRRLFRSGDSEYLINKQQVRLKDVRNLLMDTGLGTGAYSVMEQGRIDAVLSANPQERRRIFEEAAGISRYRARRRECELKLERTQQNLLRLGDVIDELKRSHSLKIQAGRARAYIEARDRVRDLRSRYFVHQWDELGLLADRQSAELTSFETSEQAARADLEAARTEVAVAQEQLAAARAEVDAAADAFRQATGEVETLGERESHLGQRLLEIDERRQVLEVRRVGVERALAERRLEAEGVASRLAAQSAEAEEWEARAAACGSEVSAATAAVEQCRREIQARRNASSERVTRLTSARNRREETSARHAAIQASREGLREQISQLKTQSDEQAAIQGELFAGARDLERTLAANQKVEERRRHRANLNTALAELDAELVTHREELAATESRREALGELIARRDGVAPGAIALLESGLPGIEGLVVDYLRVPQELAEAVEVSLGATTQAVLVEARRHGLTALEHLRSVQGGRVLLVPRDSLHPRPACVVGERLLDHLTVLDHREVFEALLGHVRVVPDREALGHCTSDGVTVWVTPEGDLLDERGILRGGTAGEEDGLVSRRSELDALQSTCALRRTELEELSRRRAQRADELREADDELGKAEDHSRALQTERERTAERERQIAARRQSLERELSMRHGEHETLDAELTRIISELQSAAHDEEELTAHVEADQAADEALTEQLAGFQATHAQVAEVHSAARLELAARRERQQALAAEERQVARSLEERAEQREQVSTEQQELVAQRGAMEAEVADLRQRLGALTEIRDQRALALEETRAAARSVTQTLETVQQAVLGREASVQTAADALSAHRLACQETHIRRDELRQKVLEELEVDLAEARPEFTGGGLLSPEADGAHAPLAVPGDLIDGALVEGPRIMGPAEPPRVALPAVVDDEQAPIDWDAIAKEIEVLRDKLARMGNVNLAAVDELGEVDERLGFLVGQRDDLVEAQKSLAETIATVNLESRDRFATAFEQVREHFKVIFRKLFRGGRADIQLVDDEDVLEAGIEITAAPPGKDARSITLLSGGERSLTAVGLLFSLFRARPSPVCLLDEVDAALDETNIDRFCSVLEDFIGESQFLVVTHARRTMSYADTIYGVTMQEHGVSRVLGLSLAEYDQVSRGGGNGNSHREAMAKLARERPSEPAAPEASTAEVANESV